MKSTVTISAVVVALTLAYSLQASATYPVGNTTNNNQTYNQPTANAGASAIAGASAFAGAVSGSYSEGGNALATGGSVKSTINNTVSPQQTLQYTEAKQDRAPVSTAYSGTIYPTAPCMGGSSGGAQGALIGLSFSTSWTDKECQIGEVARGFEQAGQKEDAMAIRCQSKIASVAPSCIALKDNK